MTRTYGGTTMADRKARRRRALMDVGTDLLGTHGTAAVTVRSVCREARLTDRYFYENFTGRDELITAVFDEVADLAATTLRDAVATQAPPADLARAAVDAFLGVLTDDPRRGRILLLEPLTDPVLSAHAAGSMRLFEQLIGSRLPAASPLQTQLTATALLGALTHLFTRWLDGTLPATRAQLTDFCVAMLANSATAARS
jgi:AcrR family transcriptional regulator